jgi:hypothetical protein
LPPVSTISALLLVRLILPLLACSVPPPEISRAPPLVTLRLPPAGGNTLVGADVALNAVNFLSNAGVVSSAHNLTVNAPTINNSGLVSPVSGPGHSFVSAAQRSMSL